MGSRDIVVITVEGGVIQHVESTEPMEYLVIDIDGNNVDSYTGTTNGNTDEVLGCLMDHMKRKREQGEKCIESEKNSF